MIVELKAVSALEAAHHSQVYNYLHAMHYTLTTDFTLYTLHYTLGSAALPLVQRTLIVIRVICAICAT